MKKLIESVRTRPVNLILMVAVLGLYFLNNLVLKEHTTGAVQYFCICFLNDLMCPLFFLGYCNLLLITSGRELKKLPWVMLLCFAASLVWEFFAPVIKPSSTTDLLDLVCYTLGGFLYWCILKLTTPKEANV